MNNETEKYLIGSLQKFSIEDGPGIRTTIFTKGCPLRCMWCHNPELIEPQQQLIQSPNNCIGCGHCLTVCPQDAITITQQNGITIDRTKCDLCLKCASECYAEALRPVAKSMTIEEILEIASQDKGFYDKTGGGITLSGGEILSHSDFALKIIDGAAAMGINICIDTSGFGDLKNLMEIALKENVTNILFDMKCIDDKLHKKYIGESNQLILENLKMLASNETTSKKLIIRMPLIKNINDTEEIIKFTGEFYKEIGIKKVNLLPYHNLGIGKERNIGGKQEEFQQPSEERIREIEIYFKNEINMKVDILGRV